jgi:hypothetical protein
VVSVVLAHHNQAIIRRTGSHGLVPGGSPTASSCREVPSEVVVDQEYCENDPAVEGRVMYVIVARVNASTVLVAHEKDPRLRNESHAVEPEHLGIRSRRSSPDREVDGRRLRSTLRTMAHEDLEEEAMLFACDEALGEESKRAKRGWGRRDSCCGRLAPDCKDLPREDNLLVAEHFDVVPAGEAHEEKKIQQPRWPISRR